MSLNRQGELASPQHRYDLSMGSDKSSSLSRSEGGVYDVVQAESRIINNQHAENNGNTLSNESYPSNGHSTIDSREGSDSSKRKVIIFIFDCNSDLNKCIQNSFSLIFFVLVVTERKVIFLGARNFND